MIMLDYPSHSRQGGARTLSEAPSHDLEARRKPPARAVPPLTKSADEARKAFETWVGADLRFTTVHQQELAYVDRGPKGAQRYYEPWHVIVYSVNTPLGDGKHAVIGKRVLWQQRAVSDVRENVILGEDGDSPHHPPVDVGGMKHP